MAKFWYSKKGEEMYRAIGKEYPKHPFDLDYEKFLRVTANSTDNKYIINRMIRYQDGEGDDAKEYILYDLQEIRRDGVGNQTKRTRQYLGMYPIPEAQRKVVYDEDGQPQTKTVGISDIITGYEIPFTVEKADELHKLGGVDKYSATNKHKTEYLVEKSNGMVISVDSYKDWRDGDFETLFNTGNAEGKPPKESKLKQPRDIKKSVPTAPPMR
jgi:hypothetical protein